MVTTPQPPPNVTPLLTKRRKFNLAALVEWMDQQPAWNQTPRLNQLTDFIEVPKVFPPNGTPLLSFGDPWRALRDEDALELTAQLQTANISVTKETVFDALSLRANRNRYHPIRDYLAALSWDGTSRLNRVFLDYFPGDAGADPTDPMVAYLENIGTKALVAAVARVMEPGCKVDHVPAIVSPQDWRKSTGIQALCPNPEWFTDDLPLDLSSRDTKDVAAIGKWFVELAEFPHARRDAERVKAYFSRQVDRYRPPYGRLTTDHPRQCVFWASSNDLELADPTGNRRFWPVPLKAKVNVEAIKADRDQLWAEAVCLYRQSYEWWLPPNIEAIARKVQSVYAESDTWDERLAVWVARKTSAFSTAEALEGCLRITEPKRADEMRAAAALKKLGWWKAQVTLGGIRAHRWFPPR